MFKHFVEPVLSFNLLTVVHVLLLHEIAFCFQHVSGNRIRFKIVQPFLVVQIHISKSFSERRKKRINGFGFGFGHCMLDSMPISSKT